MKPSFRPNPFAVPASLALLLAAAPANAQIRIIPIPRPADAAAETAPEPPKDAPEAKPEENPAEPPKPSISPEAALAKALKSAKFDRSADALLAATRAQRKGTPPTPEEIFTMNVMLGDWAAVGKTLATLPKEDGTAIYAKLLDSLAEQAIPVGAVLKAPDAGDDEEDPRERAMRQQREREDLKRKPAPLLSEDFYAVVEACPGDLKEENIPALTKLVKTSLGEGGRATLLARLATGWKGVGGSTPDGRKLAARLLSALGWIKDAAPFLPLKSEEWEAAETTELVFAMEYFTQTGIADRDERQFQKAADISARLMKGARFGNYTRPQFRLAMDRLVQLLPALEPAQAQKLIQEQLFGQTATLADLISVFGELGQTAAKSTDIQARVSSLGTQHLILEALVDKKDEVPSNAAVLVMNWLNEAEACYRAGGVVATDMSQAERLMMRRYGMGGPEKPPTLSTQQILDTAPPAELLARLNPGLAQRVQLTLVKVNILKPDQVDLQLLKDYVKKYPGLERDVCQDVLSGWISKRSKPAESEQVKQMRAYGMYVSPQMMQQGGGIPLTRLRQNQNIEQFKALLSELRGISPTPLDPTLIVQAFMTLHSGAEVYRMEDIEAIFGPPEKMVHKELLSLLGGMRERLGQEWRDPKTQQASATNRTEQEAKDEVSRGYRTALELARRGIREEGGDWASFITRGQLFYDASQYELERQVKLTDFVSLRDEAFASFRKASEMYAAKLPSLPRGQWTIEPYQAWFFVMLGASDLSQLTSNAARVDPALKSIGDSMRKLPGEASGKHLEMFAKMLGDLFPRVPANVRQIFLGSGLAIVGENNPAAASATKSLDYYKELLNEIQLRVKVDGASRVGHNQPFGAFVTLESSRQLLRESGGFSKYIQSPGGQQRMMMGGGEGQRNLREDFTKNIHAALDETFEVVSITFHDAAVKTIDLPREGWVETPLAYLVLRAKDAAVDRIPSIQMDMDFVDQPGQVVLPVASQVEPLDAKDTDPGTRPCPDLTLDLTMDEREWKDGKVVVEIQARGQGIIPKLDQLFDTARPEFDLEVTDGSMLVSEFISDGKQKLPRADRNWQLTYRRKPDLKGDVILPFPKLKAGITPSSVEYRHYQDADLVTVDAKQAEAGVKLGGAGGNGVRNTVIGVAVLAILACLVAIFRRKGKPGDSKATDGALSAPTEPTPFNTVVYLRRIGETRAQTLTETEQVALAKQIAEIEAGCFSREASATVDFPGVIRKWQAVAARPA